jgi:pimeloyl-ACP methyl ester carboxylesterase
MTIKKLPIDKHCLAYKKQPGDGPSVIFCPGFKSTMDGNKALALEEFCHDHGHEFIRFDYSGHGKSGGDFARGTISQWVQDTLAIIDQLAVHKVVLVGSSMGGWIALLAALARPEKVCGLLLIACAADMTEFYPAKLSHLLPHTDDHGRAFYSVPNGFDDGQPYNIYQSMIDDGKQHCLLNSPINLLIPISLIHGVQDDVVPWQRSKKVAENLLSKQVVLKYQDKGDHRLSTEEDLQLIIQLLGDLLMGMSAISHRKGLKTIACNH